MRVYFYINYHICVEILDRIIRINGLILAVRRGGDQETEYRARNKYEKKGQEKKKNYDRTIQCM